MHILEQAVLEDAVSNFVDECGLPSEVALALRKGCTNFKASSNRRKDVQVPFGKPFDSQPDGDSFCLNDDGLNDDGSGVEDHPWGHSRGLSSASSQSLSSFSSGQQAPRRRLS